VGVSCLPSASEAGSKLPASVPLRVAWPSELRATALVPAFPHIATDVNPNPLLGNVSIFWGALQPLDLTTGPVTDLSSCLAASQQQQMLGHFEIPFFC